MDKIRLDQIVEHFGGPMSDAEIKYLVQIRSFLATFIEEGVRFDHVVETLTLDLKYLSPYLRDFEKALSLGFTPLLLDSPTADLGPKSSDEMSDAERDFLLDVDGFLEFSIRNGLTFTTVIELLSHDFREISREGSFETALSTGFLPKATGWSKVTEDSVGRPEELAEEGV